MPIDPPYPSDLEAKGWNLDLDYEQIEQSDTWALATAEQRPWLLMLWLVSWRQAPVASLPNDDRLIAARIGMPVDQFAGWRDILLSGWELATDGRLYHRTLTKVALKMAAKRAKDRARVAAYRARSAEVVDSTGEDDASNKGVAACNALHRRDSTVCTAPSPSPKELSPSLRSGDTARKRATPPKRPESVSEDVWRDWLTLRRAKRAPVTATVLAQAHQEAGKAGMALQEFLEIWCARGSQGLQADWLKSDEVKGGKRSGHRGESAAGRVARINREREAAEAGGVVVELVGPGNAPALGADGRDLRPPLDVGIRR